MESIHMLHSSGMFWVLTVELRVAGGGSNRSIKDQVMPRRAKAMRGSAAVHDFDLLLVQIHSQRIQIPYI